MRSPRLSAARARSLPVAVAVLPNAGIRAAVTWAAHGRANIEHRQTLAEAEHAVTMHTAIAIFLLRRIVEDTAGLEAVARMRRTVPQISVIIVESPRGISAALAPFSGADATVHERSKHLRREVAEALARATRRERRRNMAAALASAAAPNVQIAVRLAIEGGEQPRSVIQLAASVGVPRKTLDRWIGNATSLTPRQLLGWCRLLAAALYLDSHATTVAAAADELRFASPSALRNLLQRYAGVTPTELRSRGGADMVFRRLRDQLTKKRESARHRGN
ncbi:MAG TPA: AraC family transcriptional regulator [Gemmatimonadaceae bacterium]|nr:AraC family transcriptional regulator [Gemmatimonadaceae bacterium]